MTEQSNSQQKKGAIVMPKRIKWETPRITVLRLGDTAGGQFMSTMEAGNMGISS